MIALYTLIVWIFLSQFIAWMLERDENKIIEVWAAVFFFPIAFGIAACEWVLHLWLWLLRILIGKAN